MLDRRIKKYGAIPVYAFNFVDYVLWKNREELKKAYDVKFEDFKFFFRLGNQPSFPDLYILYSLMGSVRLR